MGLDIRLLGPNDEAVLDRVAPDVFDNPVNPRWTAEFLNDDRHHLAVAIEDGVVVAMASGVHYVHPDKAPQLFVNEVAVAPSHQGRGIGTLVLDALLALSATLECTEAWVLTDRDNTIARRLYTRAAGESAPEDCVMYTFRHGR
jgi:ribosomal protein S18 acetylase RimI-like enzyme